MINPSQLKYLEAIGIPFWVSRDKVIEQQVTTKPLFNDVQHQTEKQQHSRNQDHSQLGTKNNNDNSVTNSAQSIIDSLNQPVSSSVAPPVQELIKESLIKTKIDDASSTKAINNEPRGTNLFYKSQDHYIFSSGDENSDWMVIGYSPEAFTGIGEEPFPNDAGVLLDNMIRAVGVNKPRQQAYYMNVVNINHTSKLSSDNSTQDLLEQFQLQINKVQPKVVLIVGQIAAQILLEIKEPLISMRSKVHRITSKQLPCVVTYYPSYLLEKPMDKSKAWKDLKLAMSAITDVS